MVKELCSFFSTFVVRFCDVPAVLTLVVDDEVSAMIFVVVVAKDPVPSAPVTAR